jgi:hypothetical protein
MRSIVATTLAALLLLPGGLAVASHGAGPSPGAVGSPAAAPATVRLLPLPEHQGGAPHPSKVRRRFRWLIPRARRDRPDGARRPLVHIVYVTTTNRPSPPLDRYGVLEVSLRAQNRWMAAQMARKWRLDTFRYRPDPRRARRVRRVDVTFVRSGRRSSRLDTVAEVAALLRARGFARSDRRYLAYVASDAGDVCGEAEYPLQDGDTGRYAAIFLYSAAGCGTRAFARRPGAPSWSEAVTLHEFVHNDGVAPLTSPHTCADSPGHICTAPLDLTDLDPEMPDLMFPYVTGPLDEKVLDRGRDDYLDHGLPYRDLRDSPFLRRT